MNREWEWLWRLSGVTILAPYLLLVLMTLGSGWTFPALAPDRLDAAPWRRLVSERDGLGAALLTSTLLSVTVGVTATAAGLVTGRALRRTTSTAWRFLLYLPFATSPVVLGVTLYDLLVRLHGAGTFAGVIVLQFVFAMALATIYFSESWSAHTDRLEQVVRTLGGGPWSVWRHAIWPRTKGLILVCFVQTALTSWVDYGLVSILGGGQVQTITMRLFAYLREANVNQAALASLLLLGPAVAGCLLSGATRAAPLSRAESRSLFREV